MADESDGRREALTEFLQQQGPCEGIDPASLLTGWAIVTSWVQPDGEAQLSKAHAAQIPHWSANGLHHEALYGDWPTPDGED